MEGRTAKHTESKPEEYMDTGISKADMDPYLDSKKFKRLFC